MGGPPRLTGIPLDFRPADPRRFPDKNCENEHPYSTPGGSIAGTSTTPQQEFQSEKDPKMSFSPPPITATPSTLSTLFHPHSTNVYSIHPQLSTPSFINFILTLTTYPTYASTSQFALLPTHQIICTRYARLLRVRRIQARLEGRSAPVTDALLRTLLLIFHQSYHTLPSYPPSIHFMRTPTQSKTTTSPSLTTHHHPPITAMYNPSNYHHHSQSESQTHISNRLPNPPKLSSTLTPPSPLTFHPSNHPTKTTIRTTTTPNLHQSRSLYHIGRLQTRNEHVSTQYAQRTTSRSK